MALFAVWLTALAPTVSRALPSAFAMPDMLDMGAWCEAPQAGHPPHAHADANPAGDPGDHASDAACGYCTLLTHSPSLGGSFHVAQVLPRPGFVPATLPVLRFAPPVARFHAPPRGPPVAAYA